MIKKILIVFTTMSIISGFFIGIMTYVNIGISEEFFSRWAMSLLFATLVMLPLGSSIMYISNKIVTRLFLNYKTIVQNIIIGILMALIMEAIMAVSTTMNIAGYYCTGQFVGFWLKTYIAALPFALLFSPIMTVFIKPKIEAYLKK